jgi:putative SOS response-associated peptidase YedK
MCGRVIQSSGPLSLTIVDGLDVNDSRMGNVRPYYNAAPAQELLVIRQNHKTGERSLDLIKWGLIPYWCKDPRGGRKPINAKAESVAKLTTVRDAYAQRRCIRAGRWLLRVACDQGRTQAALRHRHEGWSHPSV